MTDNGSNTHGLEMSHEPPGEMENGPSHRSLMVSRILSNKLLVIGGVIMLVFTVMALFAPYLTNYSPTTMDMKTRFAPPSTQHIMGTDHYGRDIYARILYGARISFEVGIVSVLISMIGGVIFGAAAGFAGGFKDSVLMRLMDALLAFPPLLLAIGLVASVGPSLMSVSVVIGIIYIPRFAYVMRSSVLTEKEKEYVEAARAIGQSGFKILLKHIGPSTLSPVIVLGTIIFAIAIIVEASLSFLGVGLPPPDPSWGTMLNESRRYLASSLWMPVFPGLAISIAVLGFNMLGDGLRDFFDPKVYGVKVRASE